MSDLRATQCDRNGCDRVEKGYAPSSWFIIQVGSLGEKLHICDGCAEHLIEALAPLVGTGRAVRFAKLQALPRRA